MKTDGHDVSVLAYYGLTGGRLELDGIDHYSVFADQWGNDIINELAQFLSVDFNLILRDIWVNDGAASRAFPTAAWFPVDHAPVGEQLLEKMDATRWLATMSHWAVEECRKSNYEVAYIPHSVDPAVYRYGRGHEGRETIAVPDDAFLVTMVAANKGFPARKGFPEAFQAMAEFQRRHKDVWLYTHTLPTSQHSGPDLHKLAIATGVALDRYRFLMPFIFWLGLEPEDMASIYQASDVLLNPSYGEGFGITILEAQACGTPVVTTNWTSMPELTFNGTAVEGFPLATPYMGYWKVPHVGAIVDALELEYNRRGALAAERKAKLTSKMIACDYSDETVYERYWRPWLKTIQEDLSIMEPNNG